MKGALHPQAAEFLNLLRAAGFPSAVCEGTRPDMSARELRERVREIKASLARSPSIDLWSVSDIDIPSEHGTIPTRIYRPDSSESNALLVYFHGGGWVTGDLDGHDNLCRALASAGRCVVASVAYRLAPEHKFPAALEDADQATLWLAEHAHEFGGDSARLAVGGDSAGGNLATVVALRSRSRSLRPVFQLLIYPVVDFDFDRESYHSYSRGYHLGRDLMMWFSEMYLSEPSQVTDPEVAPLLRDDLSALPPALIITAQCDPLRDEGALYAERLREAGVSVTYSEDEGMVHSFMGLYDSIDAARLAVEEAGEALRTAFEEEVK